MYSVYSNCSLVVTMMQELVVLLLTGNYYAAIILVVILAQLACHSDKQPGRDKRCQKSRFLLSRGDSYQDLTKTGGGQTQRHDEEDKHKGGAECFFQFQSLGVVFNRPLEFFWHPP